MVQIIEIAKCIFYDIREGNIHENFIWYLI